MAKAYTVIGYWESTGEIFARHVDAETAGEAFFVAATEGELDGDALFVVAVEGYMQEDEGLAFPGNGVVDAGTVLDQPEVFLDGQSL